MNKSKHNGGASSTARGRIAGRFTAVPSRVINDKRLLQGRAEALSVLVWMMDRPRKRVDGSPWIFRQSIVCAVFRIGKTKMQGIFRLLMRCGYLKRHGQTRVGREWGEARYVVTMMYLQEYIHPATDDGSFSEPEYAEQDQPENADSDNERNDCDTSTSANGGARNPQSISTRARLDFRATKIEPLNHIGGTRPAPPPEPPKPQWILDGEAWYRDYVAKHGTYRRATQPST